MSAHTPGPWEADGPTTPGGLGRYHEIFAPGGIAIAHTADRDHLLIYVPGQIGDPARAALRKAGRLP